MEKSIEERVMRLFQPPFRYDEVGGIILDKNNRIVFYAGEWGDVQEYYELYSALGQLLTKMMNSKWEKFQQNTVYLDSDSEQDHREKLEEKLRFKIKDLNFSRTTLKSCSVVGVKIVRDFLYKSPVELESDGFDKNSIMEVELGLESLGLYMGMNLP